MMPQSVTHPAEMRVSAVEICIHSTSVAAVRAAVGAAYEGGADRVELCSHMEHDGLTPPRHHVAAARAAFRDRPGLLVMVRPRPGDFCYTAAELGDMLERLERARHAGADGVVLGALRPGDGRIDRDALASLVQHARRLDLSVTFHRAFDATPDRDEALDVLLEAGVQRVLTSGIAWGAPGTVLDGLPQLQRTIRRAGGHIEVVLGGGVTAERIPLLRTQLIGTAAPVSVHAYSGAQVNGTTTREAVEGLVAAVRAGTLGDR